MAEEKKDQAKPKRKQPTAAERLAAAKAKVEALEKAAAERNDKQVKDLRDRRATLVKQIADRQAKIRTIDAELKDLGIDVSTPAPAPKS